MSDRETWENNYDTERKKLLVTTTPFGATLTFCERIEGPEGWETVGVFDLTIDAADFLRVSLSNIELQQRERAAAKFKKRTSHSKRTQRITWGTITRIWDELDPGFASAIPNMLVRTLEQDYPRYTLGLIRNDSNADESTHLFGESGPHHDFLYGLYVAWERLANAELCAAMWLGALFWHNSLVWERVALDFDYSDVFAAANTFAKQHECSVRPWHSNAKYVIPHLDRYDMKSLPERGAQRDLRGAIKDAVTIIREHKSLYRPFAVRTQSAVDWENREDGRTENDG